MTTSVQNYCVWCETEAKNVYTWDTSTPRVCPNNNTHTINENLTTIVATVSSNQVEVTSGTIIAQENSNGYFETGHIEIAIPSGTPGTITSHDVTWPMDILLWRTLITPTTDMVGDYISVVASPNTTIGVLTAPASIGDTTFNVNSTVTANMKRGFLVNLYDGVNNNILGRCTNVNVKAGTITVQTATTNSFSAGTTYVQIGVFTLKDIFIADTATIDIGSKGAKGKLVNAGMILRVYYTNNSGTSKTIRWRYESYAME